MEVLSYNHTVMHCFWYQPHDSVLLFLKPIFLFFKIRIIFPSEYSFPIVIGVNDCTVYVAVPAVSIPVGEGGDGSGEVGGSSLGGPCGGCVLCSCTYGLTEVSSLGAVTGVILRSGGIISKGLVMWCFV